MIKRVAIQGVKGAFHEIASRLYFENEEIKVVPCDTFTELFDQLKDYKADYGIMAIENTVAGGILPNYALLRESKMKIIGEVYLRIEQNLLALPGQKIEDIKEVFSHYMAILQCQSFFRDYPHIKLIASEDTALSAKKISEDKQKGVGAIASKLASEMYGLEMMYEGIETNKRNYTRFLVLLDENKYEGANEVSDKSSICFTLAHKTGSLSQILSIFAFYNINLTKIQSLPILGKEWQYQFYVDLAFDDYKRYRQSIDAIRPLTAIVEVLGEYKAGIKKI